MQVYSQRTSKNQVWYLFIRLQVISTQLIILYYPVILSHQHSTTVSLPSLFIFSKETGLWDFMHSLEQKIWAVSNQENQR